MRSRPRCAPRHKQPRQAVTGILPAPPPPTSPSSSSSEDAGSRCPNTPSTQGPRPRTPPCSSRTTRAAAGPAGQAGAGRASRVRRHLAHLACAPPEQHRVLGLGAAASSTAAHRHGELPEGSELPKGSAPPARGLVGVTTSGAAGAPGSGSARLSASWFIGSSCQSFCGCVYMKGARINVLGWLAS